jgi:glutaconyl-CoA/methylmalonyl-CoA decarboxylase subunit gamma
MKLIVKVENQSFEVEVGDIHDRPIIATIDGEPFEVWPEDVQLVRPSATLTTPVAAASTLHPAPHSAPQAAPAVAPKSSGTAAPVTAGKAVNAPLPGVIVAVSVKPGEIVTHGQELCTIEAMKMKNVIRAGRAGTIAAVHVTLNQHVKHHDVLLEFTD